ncbi:alpha/beta fold hydrolase [Rhodopseudomonas palustris]|uniref:Alpha/beta fold hydrolase n=1 Tax=Rhodopseudomonas palustris TaxID=1076 RepID=A0A418VNT9_RHOPL|nr:alpha/beta fold hydrolase [Rhodopseudomonas palustris]RJF77866.1 alpha/beta fold hydrolase [Rhodopseudomonas palustris]
MKRPLTVFVGLSAVAAVAYFSFSHWAIRHENISFYDEVRQRPIAVDLAVRRDTEMKAEAGMTMLPVAIVSHGNTVKNTEYSFLANVLAARGFLVASIQHDLPTDAPLMTTQGSLYVGRLKVYERGEKNIIFTIDQLKKRIPYADYDHLTLLGHSNGGDISMFFAQQHPELVRRVVTLDNLRVPFVTSGAAKILSFRSEDPHFKTDPGVLPDSKIAKQAGIEIIDTGAQHNELSDRGPESVKSRIQATLDQFLSEPTNSKVSPIDPRILHNDPRAMGP